MTNIALFRVERRLKEWGFWRLREINQECGGAPRQSAFCAAVRQDFATKKYVSHALIDVEIEDTDRLVKLLGHHDKTLEEIVRKKYTSMVCDAEVVELLGIPRATFYRKIKIAKAWLARNLNSH